MRLRAEWLCGAASLAIFCCLAQAQLSRAEAEQRLAALRASSIRNLRSLRDYTWQQRTEFVTKGKIRSYRVEDIEFGSDGLLVHHPIGARGSGVSGGKADKFADRMDRMMSLAERYLYPTGERILAAFDAGKITVTQREDSNRARVRIRDYFKPGDTLELTFDTARNQLRELHAFSYLERSEGVEIDVEYNRLPDGTNYAARLTVELPADKDRIEIRSQAKGHRKRR